MIWCAVAGREVDQPEFGIEGRCVPNRCTATHGMVGAGRPSIATELARLWQCIGAPQDGAGLGIEGGEAPAYPVLPTGDAAVDDAVVIEGRTGDGVAVLILLNGRLPHHLARLHVQRHDAGVELAEKQQPLTHGQTAVGPAAAERTLPRDSGPVLPEDFSSLGIEREDVVVAWYDVDDAILHKRRCLEGVFGIEPRAFEAGHPGPFELLNVEGVNLL